MPELSHFDSDGNARMVDISGKQVTHRTARASGVVRMKCSTAELIKSNSVKKGDVIGVARLAGISGSKWTPHLIPMCHPIAIDSVDVQFDWQDSDSEFVDLMIRCSVSSTGRTGVEMEALTAATLAALTVYDMCKSHDREMEIHNVRLVEKTGGKSGHFVRKK